MKLTPKDIENPKRKSGYDHVNSASPGPNAGGGYVQRWRAASGDKNGRGAKAAWRGRTRRIAVEAAQDYCDYINGDPVRLAAVLKRVGKTRTPRDPMNDDEVKAALGVLRDARAQRRGRQGYVYLMCDGHGLKVGYSVKPEARVSELQTGNSREIRLLATMAGTEDDERALHMKYIADNLLLEWFKPSAGLYQEFGLELPSAP